MNPGILVGAGFLLGTVGVKAVKSPAAKQLFVKTAVQGLRLKEGAETLMDTAKAEFDDVMAEANYEYENLQNAQEIVEADAIVATAPAATPATAAAPAAVAAVPEAAGVTPAATTPAAVPAKKDPVAEVAEIAKKAVSVATKSAGAGRGAGRGAGHGRAGK